MVGVLVVLSLLFALAKSCGLMLDSDITFSCSDVSWLYDDVQDAGEKESTSENISELLDKQADLAEAEQDCEDKGEAPDYDGPLH